MKPKTPETPSNRDMFRPLLVDIINPQHELVLLERVVDWGYFEREWSAFFTSTTGRPATSPRLIAGLFYLQHMYGHSDETVLTMFLQPSFTQVIVDTTVMQKAITHSTDAKLLENNLVLA
jgi:IS5 family transposase